MATTLVARAPSAVLPTVQKGRVMAMGHSLIASIAPYDPQTGYNSHNGSNAGGHGPGDYLFWGNAVAGSPMDILGSAADPGLSQQQIIDTHLQTVLNARPEYCFVWALPANDIRANGEFTSAMLRAGEVGAMNPMMAAGITPIVATMPPVANAQNVGVSHTEIERYNAYISNWAEKNGVPLVDCYSALVDPSTGSYKSGYSSDGTHPNERGAAALIPLFAALIGKLTRNAAPRISLPGYNTSITGRTDNPLLSGNNGLPTGWGQAANGGTISLGAAADGIGNRLLMTKTSASGDLTLQAGAVFPVTPGDEWELAFYLDSNNLGNKVPALVYGNNGAAIAGCGSTNTAFPFAFPDGTLVHMRGKVPAGVTSFTTYIVLGATTGATMGIRRYTMRDLTTLGV